MIAIFGGTFDPIHLGHIHIAQHVQARFALDKVYFMPCKLPVHKAEPGSSSQHRIAMLEKSLANHPSFILDKRELERQTPSYTVLSMHEIRSEHPNQAIFFIIGMDSLNQLHLWHKWRDILSLCNFIVCQRPGDKLNVDDEIAPFVTQFNRDVTFNHFGQIFVCDNPQLDIASSQIRSLIKTNNLAQCESLLAANVFAYIKQQQLYQNTDEPC